MLDAPATLGEESFLDGGPAAAGLRAVTHGEAQRLSFDAFESLSAREPRLARDLLLDLGAARRRRAAPPPGAGVDGPMAALPPFPNYTQIPSRLPISAWQLLRVCSLIGALVVVLLLVAVPDTGLFVMWKVVIPLLPLLFMTAPGLWRNLCPLAASNQMPRCARDHARRSRRPSGCASTAT